MKVVVLYHPKSDHGGMVEDFARDYKYSRGHRLELVSLETREGAATASLYDITQYPAILALADDGGVQNVWQGLPLPRMQDLDVYAMQMSSQSQFVRAI